VTARAARTLPKLHCFTHCFALFYTLFCTVSETSSDPEVTAREGGAGTAPTVHVG